MTQSMGLKEIIEAIRSFPGVTRKSRIHEIVDLLPTDSFPAIAAAEGEDAAAIDDGDHYTLIAVDGIMESLVKADPFMAGYFAVLVNVNDIAAMGGRAVAMVDVMSTTDQRICGRMLRGLEEGVRRFNVPIVGGHTHPDSAYHAIDIAIIGTVPKDDIILSSTALPGDDVIFIIDLVGHYPATTPFCWETTLERPPEMVRAQMQTVTQVAAEHLVRSGKDMSNPGSVGTLGMLLETSEMGATVDLRKIPTPAGETDLIRWLEAYQGCGFVFTADPANSARVIELFRACGCTGAVVGKVDNTRQLKLVLDGETGTLFDFEHDIITGCRPKQHAGKSA